MPITADQLERRDFSLVTVHYRRPRPISTRHPVGWQTEIHRFIVGSPSVPTARFVARAYAAMRWGKPEDINIYPRNYVQDARRLVVHGECIQGPEET